MCRGCPWIRNIGAEVRLRDLKKKKHTKKFSLPSDPRFIEVLNGRTKGQIHPAKMFHLAHMVVFQICFK